MSLLGLFKTAAVFTRTTSTWALTIITKYPKSSMAAAAVLSIPFAHYGLISLSRWRLETPILKKIEVGTKPELLPTFITIDRPSLEDDLNVLLHPDKEDNKFGVVIGPSGMGKTAVLRKLCCRRPEGVLYYEVFDPVCFAQDLGKVAGMIQRPKGIISFFFTYLTQNSYPQYHVIPSDESAIAYVLDKIGEQAKKFKSKHGRAPVLVIDGIDLLAKDYKQVFLKVVDRAKFLSNSHTLKVILVSGEGSVMPLIEKSSSRSRMAKIVEVEDIPDKEAVHYLNSTVPKELAEKIVSACGGRFVHLSSVILEYRSLKRKSIENIDTQLRSITDFLLTHNVQRDMKSVMTYPPDQRKLQKKIMDYVLSMESISANAVKELNADAASVKKEIEHLVSANLLRYQSDGSVVFHSRLVQWAMVNNELEFCVEN